MTGDDPHSDPDLLANQAYADADGLDLRNQIQESYRSRSRPWFRWLLKRLRLPQAGLVLELGSGPGELWSEAPEVLPPGMRLLLSDLSQGMLLEGRRRLQQAGVGASYAQLNAQALPLPGASCQVVIGIGLLDHLEQPAQALAEIRRVLQPGGRACFSAGGAAHLQELRALTRPYLPEMEFGGSAARFGLENGGEMLAPFFDQVRLERYPDELVFTQVEPLLVYILSEPRAAESLDRPRRRALRADIAAQIERNGELRVTISKGLFEAQ